MSRNARNAWICCQVSLVAPSGAIIFLKSTVTRLLCFISQEVCIVMRSVWCSLVSVAVVFCLASVGCGPAGPNLSPVKGTLTIDGQPADNVMITLSPVDAKLSPASGQVKGGAFTLSSGAQGAAGAAPGKYKVVLTQQSGLTPEAAAAAYGAGASGAIGPPKAPELSFPKKYTSADSSDKEVEVKAGANDLKIDITK
jgi:hypothetical protein